ncbi:TonB-dependent receptor domain-containing protein [Flagellimonas meridianipacifica]|uniref:Outer membrane receptor protein involved in Fe transport n=1 Tax=Flagellimonas meridianipacifica TaxID=1080225 RepID=A0A2T0MCD4_9FLAO|nr:TonB-dependent receptor [Allomuricauda pacifica]PRX55150.1 outer membrane receptor protein involved in Fe transport [Allomuricauda pacifica]
MRKLFLGLVLLLALSLQAQRPQNLPQIKLSGTVIDKDTGQPLEYATLVLQSVRNPDVITGGITDIFGNFEVETPIGRYNISVEYISYSTYKLENQLLRSNTDLGQIALSLDVSQLDEVEVIAERTTVELRLDKKIYNVGKDLTVRGGTVSDVLDNVPSVSVDVEGNVQLRGNDDVRILINGKPSAITGLNSTDALRQLPAESIEKVEVITSPSARYDAEGSGGIINIILRRSKLQGLNGALTGNLGYPYSAGINGNLNLRTGALNIFTNTGYNYRESPGNSLNDTDFFDQDGVFTNSIREERDFERIRKGLNANFGVEWYVGENTSITNSVFIRDRNNSSETTNNFSQTNSDGVTTGGFRFDPETEDDNTFQYAFNFDTQFNENSQHKLTFAFQYETSDEVEESLIVQNGFDSESVRTAEDQQRLFFQMDYVVPLGKNAQFELGYRGDFNQLDTDYDVIFINPTLDELGITDPSNLLDFEQRINAFYTQYGNKFGKFSFLGGLRYEATKQIVNQLETNDFNENDFNGLFPTLNLNYEFNEGESFQFGYNRRIRRPRSFFLNPFPSRSSPTNLFQGNPNLAPSFSNQVDLGYLKRFKKLTLNGSIYYQRATDVITFITEETGETTLFDGEIVNILRRTPVNLAENERYGFEITTNFRPTRKWNLNGNVNIFNLITRGDFNGQNFDAENLSWFIRVNNKITLPKSIDWQTRIFYRGPTENAQTRNQGIFSLNLAFSKDFFQEKASLAFNINDAFNSRRRVSETVTPFFNTDSEFQFRVRSYNLSFTYRFNQKKKRGGDRNRNFDGDGEEFGT